MIIMDSNIYISEQLIKGHIDAGSLDLSNIPDFNKFISLKTTQSLLGVVTRCESLDNYAFILTNQYGVNDSSVPSDPVQLYLDKKQWKDTVPLEDGMWVIFELQKQQKKTRHAAINARSVFLTMEDYNICKPYLHLHTQLTRVCMKISGLGGGLYTGEIKGINHLHFVYP